MDTRESLRAKLLDGINQVMSHRFIWGSMSTEQQNITLAARELWSDTTSPVVNAALDQYVANLNTIQRGGN